MTCRSDAITVLHGFDVLISLLLLQVYDMYVPAHMRMADGSLVPSDRQLRKFIPMSAPQGKMLVLRKLWSMVGAPTIVGVDDIESDSDSVDDRSTDSSLPMNEPWIIVRNTRYQQVSTIKVIGGIKYIVLRSFSPVIQAIIHHHRHESAFYHPDNGRIIPFIGDVVSTYPVEPDQLLVRGSDPATGEPFVVNVWLCTQALRDEAKDAKRYKYPTGDILTYWTEDTSMWRVRNITAVRGSKVSVIWWGGSVGCVSLNDLSDDLKDKAYQYANDYQRQLTDKARDIPPI